jgi:predicted adenylyl cyclase CyaB
MPRNVEIKAEVEDLAALRRRVEEIADHGPSELRQVDTFFACADGRLKLRELDGSSAQLIYYRRADQAGPRESRYLVTPIPDAGSLKQILGAACGSLGVVSKRRWLYLVGATRIHLDQVEGLGSFIELEVVLHEDQAVEQGVVIAERLMESLGIRHDQLIETAYFDLLQQRSS